MIKWLFISITLYYLGKMIMFFLPAFKFKKDEKNIKNKEQIRSKISKMDIVDAEFEEGPK